MECGTNVRQVLCFVGASSTGSVARAGKHTSTTLDDGFIGALPSRRCPFDIMASLEPIQLFDGSQKLQAFRYLCLASRRFVFDEIMFNANLSSLFDDIRDANITGSQHHI